MKMGRRIKNILSWVLPVLVLLVGVMIVKMHTNAQGSLEGPKIYGGYFGAAIAMIGGLGLSRKMPQE